MPYDSASLAALAKSHNAAVDSLVAAFEAHVKEIVAKASARTLAMLQARLELGKTSLHLIDSTPVNSKVLRGVDQLFAEQMTQAGYDALVDAYVKQFGVQFRYFDELLAVIAPGQSARFTADDTAWLTSQQMASADSLKAVVDIAGALAQQRVLFGVGGLSIADFAEVLADRFSQVLPSAARLADTAITVFWRSIAERGFAVIEEGIPADSTRYAYWGPDDKLTRPFCQHLVESGKSYTRAQIDAMNNGQLPNVFLTGGGFRCRHLFLIQALASDHLAA